ncbi:MAG: hypothetical protein ACRCVG_03270 [Methanobacteriaceae archaeon]
MIAITKKEEMVLKHIKMLKLEYNDGVPSNILKMELGIYEHDLNDILNELSRKKILKVANNKITIENTAEGDMKETSTVGSQKEVKKAELDKKEAESLEIIKKLVSDDNIISKYLLEGNLLYGNLKLSNFKMYHIILSLENKKIIKRVIRDDGEYYRLLIN